VRAPQLTLGSDTFDYALAYVDDFIVHSHTFELHLKHFDTVLSRLTRSGFAVKAAKRNISKIEFSFLDHVIRQGLQWGADKSLARPTSRCRRTEWMVSLERWV
jgi:hypothetical protein